MDAGLAYNDCTFSLSQYIGAPLLDGTIVDGDCFIEELSEIKRNIVNYLMEGHDTSILSIKLKFSVDEIQSVIEVLQKKAVTFFKTQCSFDSSFISRVGEACFGFIGYMSLWDTKLN